MAKPTKNLAPAFFLSISLLTLTVACGSDADSGTSNGSPQGGGAAGTNAGGAAGTNAGGAAGSNGGSNGGGAAGARADGCPSARPVAGTACDHAGACFGYESNTSCPSAWVCTGGAWLEQQGSCAMPAPACPADIPMVGGACPVQTQVCDYPLAGCGGERRTCGTGNVWVGQVLGSCNPPACPDEEPKTGTPCSSTFGAPTPPCTFAHEGCSNAYMCTTGTWTLTISNCGGAGGSGGAGAGGSAGGGAGGAGAGAAAGSGAGAAAGNAAQGGAGGAAAGNAGQGGVGAAGGGS